jgi:hypothetical protein
MKSRTITTLRFLFRKPPLPSLRVAAVALWLLTVWAGAAGVTDGGPDPVLGERARGWLVDHAAALRESAQRFQVDPLVAATIVATELDRRTMMDDLEEGYVHRLLREKDARYFERLTRAFTAPAADDPEIGALDRMLYHTSIGPAQIQVRLALEMEPRVAAVRKTKPRDLRTILSALLDDEGCLGTMCAVLRHAADAYLRQAGLDISRDVGRMATAYNQGSPVSRARQLKKDPKGAAAFKKNEMGRYAEALAPRVRAVLDTVKPPER